MGIIIAFTLLGIVLIILCIALSKVSAEKEIYMSKYQDMDKISTNIINRQSKVIDKKMIEYKELDELYEQKVIENDELKKKLKQYEENHTHFVKEVPMKSLAFTTEVVVPREFRNDKGYMDTIDNATCNKLAEAIFESKAYEVTEQFNACYNQYTIKYLFRFYK
jgi:hypothetical protein